MDRTHIFNSNVIHANKKPNDSHKLGETFLCDEIHDNLRSLALVIPFGDDFKEVFERGMFIKPNANAFPHVMKYLFMICDATDFKKKFCWPIYNKAAEATFRNSTIELLNKLNAKYNLGLGEVKNKILIFPGGMEFMRVIYELTRLSMQIILKRNGVNDPETITPVMLAGAKIHFDNLQDLYDFVMDFKKQIEEYSVKLKMKTDTLYPILQKLVAKTNITSQNILEDEFTRSWQQVQDHILNRGIEPQVENLMRFQDDCQKLEDKVSTIFKQQTIKFDTQALASFSSEMQKQYPQKYQKMARIVENGQFNLDNILEAIPLAIPTMLEIIESNKPRSTVAMAYESKRLEILSRKADELLHRTFELGVPSDAMKANNEGVNVAPAFKSIKSMILTTPIISYDAIRRAESVAIQPKRISLLEDAYQLRSASSIINVAVKSLNSVLEESPRCSQKQFLSPNRIFSREPKSKLDPMAILQSITKREKREKHATSGNFKPKTMNFTQRQIHQHDQSKTNDTTMSVPDFSSTLLNNSLDMQFSVNEQINNSLAKSIAKNEYDHDLNCSPSGRIEPLVTSKLNLSGIKVMKFVEKDSDIQNSNQYPVLEDRLPLGPKSTTDWSNIENNQNAPNKNAFNLNSMIDENDESLMNMSDRILENLDDIELT